MRFEHVHIESTGFVLPPRVVTSEELEDRIAPLLRRLGLPPGQIRKLSGVRERRYWEPEVRPSAVAALAGEQALQQAGIEAGELDVLINTSVSRDYLEPAVATLVGGQLGVGHHCLTFDVTHACLGFLMGLQQAAALIELGQADRVLVVCGENPSAGIQDTLDRLASDEAGADDFRDNFASMTLGCGAAAAVLTRDRVSRTGHRLLGGAWRSATEHNTLCLANELEMRSDPHGLLVHGVDLAVETWPLFLEALGWSPDTIDEFVCHQVSLAHFSDSFRRLEVSLDKALLTFPFLGNCGPASLPITLALGVAQGRIREGQRLCLYAVGSGLGAMILGAEW